VKARGTPRTAYTRGRETGNVGGNADFTPSHDSSQGRSFFSSWQSEHEADGASVRLHKTAEMRTRPRLSDSVAKVHKVRGTLVMHRPKRSVDVESAKREPTRGMSKLAK